VSGIPKGAIIWCLIVSWWVFVLVVGLLMVVVFPEAGAIE